jgi:hypothetical protein
VLYPVRLGLRAEGGPTLTLSRAAAAFVERDERWHETTLKTTARLRAAQRRRLERVVGPGIGKRQAVGTLALRKTGAGTGCGRHYGRWGGWACGRHAGGGAAAGARTALKERVAYI